MGILEYDSKGMTQVGFFDLININAVVPDLSILYIVKTVDQVSDRCFSCPVEPTNASFCPGFA